MTNNDRKAIIAMAWRLPAVRLGVRLAIIAAVFCVVVIFN